MQVLFRQHMPEQHLVFQFLLQTGRFVRFAVFNRRKKVFVSFHLLGRDPCAF